MTAYKVLHGDILLIVFNNTITVLLKHEQDRRRVPNYSARVLVGYKPTNISFNAAIKALKTILRRVAPNSFNNSD